MKKNIEEKYIILNKPFIGGYLSEDGHDAHEIINFFRADNGMHFIYDNPYGQFIARKKKNIKPVVEYVVFTSKSKSKSFYIKYVAKIECTLHSATISKNNITYNEEKTNDYLNKGILEIEKTLKEKYNINSLAEITYDGVPVRELFSDDLKVLPFTFVCQGLYEPLNVIKIDGTKDDFDYNFQRNFGYVSEKTKNPDSYKKIYKHLENIDKEFRQIPINKFKALSTTTNKEELDSLEPNTFLDLISMHKEEESYTKLLGNLISCDKRLIKKLVKIILNKQMPIDYNVDSEISTLKDIKGDFIFNNKYLYTEYDIERVGRVDLYTESDNCRLVIENKIESGINYVTKNKEVIDQLNRYYRFFSDERKKDNKSNIFVILAPEYNHEDIIAELNNLPNKMNNHWLFIGYSDIYDFIKENKEIIVNTKYGKYYNDLLLLSRRQSFNVDRIAQLKLTKNKISNK